MKACRFIVEADSLAKMTVTGSLVPAYCIDKAWIKHG
jgi:hypothetical protein